MKRKINFANVRDTTEYFEYRSERATLGFQCLNLAIFFFFYPFVFLNIQSTGDFHHRGFRSVFFFCRENGLVLPILLNIPSIPRSVDRKRHVPPKYSLPFFFPYPTTLLMTLITFTKKFLRQFVFSINKIVNFQTEIDSTRPGQDYV